MFAKGCGFISLNWTQGVVLRNLDNVTGPLGEPVKPIFCMKSFKTYNLSRKPIKTFILMKKPLYFGIFFKKDQEK